MGPAKDLVTALNPGSLHPCNLATVPGFDVHAIVVVSRLEGTRALLTVGHGRGRTQSCSDQGNSSHKMHSFYQSALTQ